MDREVKNSYRQCLAEVGGILAPSARTGLADLAPGVKVEHTTVTERLHLVGQHPEITDRAGTFRDRARDVGQYPAPVMMDQPTAEQRLRQAEAGLVLLRELLTAPA